jgi:predicted NBD/HSP70 family sugar kinase
MMKQDQDTIRQHNKKMILDIIRTQRPISRSEISRITKMSPTSISRIVGELCDEGVIKETDTSMNKVGRKAVILDINPQAVYTIGVDLDKEFIKIGIMDFCSNIVAGKKVEYDETEYEPETTSVKICSIVESIIEESSIHRQKFISIGVSVPGVIDAENGVVVFSSQLGWKNVKFASLLEESLRIATVVENDLKVMALAEHFHGSAKASKWTALINFGSGVGSVLVRNGEIFQGRNNRAGEIGHTTIDPFGTLCECGRRGCLQTYIADWALIQEAQKVAKVSGIQEIVESARKQELWAQNILQRATVFMGITISNILCMYNPDTVILCGSLFDDYPELFQLIEELLKSIIWEPYEDSFRLCLSELRERSRVMGAAIKALNNSFQIY